MKALQQTGWTTPEAAINWILEHPGETNTEFTRLVRQASGGDTAAVDTDANGGGGGSAGGTATTEEDAPDGARWLTDERQMWICNVCTLHNESRNARCEVCQQGQRPD